MAGTHAARTNSKRRGVGRVIEAGSPSLGIDSIDRVDVLIVDGTSAEDPDRIRRSGAQLVVSQAPIERSALTVSVTAIAWRRPSS